MVIEVDAIIHVLLLTDQYASLCSNQYNVEPIGICIIHELLVQESSMHLHTPSSPAH